MSKSARIMFKKLGFIRTIDTEITDDTLILYDKGADRVAFNVESKYFYNSVFSVHTKDKNYLNKLNEAINQQIKELGWLDE